jgi:hypothetical protein
MAARGETDEQSAWYWCQTVSSAAQSLHDAGSADLAELETKLNEADVPEESIAELVQVLQDVGTADALDDIVQGGAEGIYVHYRPAAAEAEAAGGEDAWQTYVAQTAGSWDGREESWPDFRNWFLHYANEAGVGEYATELLDRAENSDKVAVLAEYGIAAASPAEATAASPAEAAAAPSAQATAAPPAEAAAATSPADTQSPSPAAPPTAEVDDGFEEGDLAGLFGGIDMDEEELDEAMAEIAAMSDEEYAALVAEIEAEAVQGDESRA